MYPFNNSLSLIPTQAEKKQLLVEFNNTAVAYPKDKTIVHLFEEQVAKTPHHIALIFEGEQLTYRALNERANQLAYHLKSIGVREETLVPICIERSLEMIVGIIGILKAGGAYVPIDPEYPEERIAYMIQDTAAHIILSSKESRLKLGVREGKDIQIIEIDRDWSIINGEPAYDPQPASKPHHLVYVIYTSGSTGRPKGVMIEHKSLVNLITSQTREFGIQSNERILQFSNYCFDASVEQIFLALFNGARLVLVSKEVLVNTEDLLQVIIREKVTHFHATPSFLQNIKPGKYGQLKRVIAGGESCPVNLARTWSTFVQFYNEYGPTETTVTSIMHRCVKDVFPEVTVPIGMSIANTQVYILDDSQNVVPIGVAGNLCIGGDGLARGYLNYPELTKDKFIPDPFSSKVGARLYKTGDIARYLDDTKVEFLGRRDDQVKIRGFRIELGEIEYNLSQHPLVKNLVLISHEDSLGEKQIVAYIVSTQAHMLNTRDLRRFLSKKLPEYMMPSLFIFLETLPMTANGKVDRSSLPVPNLERPEIWENFVGPRDALEITLKKIWEECLKVRSIGIQDDFFELGGNSIQAAQIFSKIRKTIGKKISLAVLFQAPTIEQLAMFIREEGAAAQWSSLVSIQPYGSRQPLFCMHAGAGTVLLYRNLSYHLGLEQPVYGLQAKGLNGDEPPHTRIEDMAAHYIKEIRKVQTEGPYFLVGYCLGGILAFEMAQQLTRQGHIVALVASINGVSPTYTDSSNLLDIEEEDNLDEINSPLSNEISDLWKKIMHTTFKAKIIFLIYKLVNYNQRYKIRKLFYKFYISRNLPLPEALGKYYFLETNDDIAKAYKLKPYPGKMIIFRSPEIYPDPHLGWSGLLTGGIETRDISGEHRNRREIMNEPFVQRTAKELNYYLRTHTIPL